MTKREGKNGHDEDGYGVIRSMYFDMDGKPLAPEVFLARYPHGRVCIARDSKRAIRLSCEFVGINHANNPEARPLIYEVLVCFAGSNGTQVLASYWAPSVDTARRAYTTLKRFIHYGGYFAYYAKYAITWLWGRL